MNLNKTLKSIGKGLSRHAGHIQDLYAKNQRREAEILRLKQEVEGLKEKIEKRG